MKVKCLKTRRCHKAKVIDTVCLGKDGLIDKCNRMKRLEAD